LIWRIVIFASAGENGYFVLEPGYQVILEGGEDGEKMQLTMSVLLAGLRLIL